MMALQVKQPADVGVRDEAGQLKFLFESSQSSRGRGYLGPNGLQGDARTKFEVLCLIHLAHTAMADEPAHPEAPRDDIVWRECRWRAVGRATGESHRRNRHPHDASRLRTPR